MCDKYSNLRERNELSAINELFVIKFGSKSIFKKEKLKFCLFILKFILNLKCNNLNSVNDNKTAHRGY